MFFLYSICLSLFDVAGVVYLQLSIHELSAINNACLPAHLLTACPQ